MKHLTTLAICTALALAGCGDEDSDTEATPDDSAATTSSTPENLREEAAAQCDRFGQNVDEYDVTQPGASRDEYLMLLHKLQRECPEQAEELGLTGEGLPECEPGQLEDCTDYLKR